MEHINYLQVALIRLGEARLCLAGGNVDESEEHSHSGLKEARDAIASLLGCLLKTNLIHQEVNLKQCIELEDITYTSSMYCYYPPAALAETVYYPQIISLETIRMKARALMLEIK